MTSRPLVEVEGVGRRFPIRPGLFGRAGAHVHAVQDVSFVLATGAVLGVVGESGSGKSTLGRLVLRLLPSSTGRIRFDGTDLTTAGPDSLRRFRRHAQMVFQDPYSSLNPRMRVGAALAEAMRVHGLANRATARDRVADLLESVGLKPDHRDRLPRAFSGGQRQRVAIARALAVEPRLIVADEPVSALDVSIQAEILNLLKGLQERLSLTMLFISHDLAVVELIADRVLVLYLGRVMELGPTAQVLRMPRHPYTRALIDAVPGRRRADGSRARPLAGEIPSPIAPPSGCVFRTRCPFAQPACAETVPPLTEVAPGHAKACLRDDLMLEDGRQAA